MAYLKDFLVGKAAVAVKEEKGEKTVQEGMLAEVKPEKGAEQGSLTGSKETKTSKIEIEQILVMPKVASGQKLEKKEPQKEPQKESQKESRKSKQKSKKLIKNESPKIYQKE